MEQLNEVEWRFEEVSTYETTSRTSPLHSTICGAIARDLTNTSKRVRFHSAIETRSS